MAVCPSGRASRECHHASRGLPLRRYLWAKHRAVRLRRQGRDEEAELVWERRHAAGAEEIFQMLVDLRGFYLKVRLYSSAARRSPRGNAPLRPAAAPVATAD